MLFFVTLPNGSIIDIDLDSTDKVRDIILIMDKSDKILSLGLIDNFHLWYQSDTGYKLNLMEDLNKTIGECGITLESKIYMQVKYTNLLEIAMKNRLIPDFENEVEKIQKRFRGNQVRKELREEYPELFNKNKIVKIESRAGDLVDKIKLHFNDNSIIEYGGEGGSPLESFILKPNEKIIKVVQYEGCNYGNGQFLGCRIDFHTNFDRIYKIAGFFCKKPCNPRRGDYSSNPQKIFYVSPDKLFTGLIFDKSVLVDIEYEFDDKRLLPSKIRSQNSLPWLDDTSLSLMRKYDLVHTLQSHLDDEELQKHKIHGNSKSIAKKTSKNHLMKVYSLYSTKAEGGGKYKNKSIKKKHKNINRKSGKSKKSRKNRL